jgi:tetratricopeptide (TPR) repeat protein
MNPDRTKNLACGCIFAILLRIALASPAHADDLDALFEKGVHAIQAGNSKLAIEYFTKVIARDPKCDAAYANRASVYLLLGEDKQALQDYSTAIVLAPKDAAYYANRGGARTRLRQFKEAVADCTEALRLDPKKNLALVNRSSACISLRRFDDAIADCTAAIAINPDYGAAYANRSVAYAEKGMYDLAIADCECALRHGVEDAAGCYLNRSNCYYEKGNFWQAISDAGSAVLSNSAYGPGYGRLAWLFATCKDARLRDGKKALDNARKACDLSSWQDAGCLETLAAAYAETSSFAEAIKWQKKAIERLENSPTSNATSLNAARARLELYKQSKPYHE